MKEFYDLKERKKLHRGDLEALDHRGNTPLHLAAKLSKAQPKYLEVVQDLLDAGSRLKSKDKNGWTVVNEAVSTQNVRLLGILLDYAMDKKASVWDKKKCQIVKKL